MTRRPTTRHLVLAGSGLVGASTAATSAVSLYDLAVLCGIPEPLSAALPIALDAGAAVAALVWITERGELRAWGRGVALAALVATLTGNGVSHAVASGLVAVTLPLVLVVGSCIPAMLFACVHLAALMAKTPTAAPARRAKTPAGAVSTPRAAPAGLPGRVDPAAKLSPRDWTRAHWPTSGRKIQLATGVAKGYAYRLAAEVRAEREAAS